MEGDAMVGVEKEESRSWAWRREGGGMCVDE